MTRPALNREEQALEDLLQAHPGLVAVCLTEPFHPGSQQMADRLQTLAESRRDIHVVTIGLEGYRGWAFRHAIFGTPCIALFRGGELLCRLNGTLAPEALHSRLQRLA